LRFVDGNKSVRPPIADSSSMFVDASRLGNPERLPARRLADRQERQRTAPTSRHFFERLDCCGAPNCRAGFARTVIHDENRQFTRLSAKFHRPLI
jgi:hypothetical protein